jgi:hypothetical protein
MGFYDLGQLMKTRTEPFDQREAWLVAAMGKFFGLFKRHGYTIPDDVLVSCSFPAMGSRAKIKGQAWVPDRQVLISPAYDDGLTVLETLCHELIHVCLPAGTGHKGAFRKAMKAVGLQGKPTSTALGPELAKECEQMLRELGAYPHRVLRPCEEVKKEGTRLLKAECPDCDYVIRVTRVHVEEKGLPICPVCHVAFVLSE